MTRFSLVLFAVALTLGTTPAFAKAKKKSATHDRTRGRHRAARRSQAGR